MTTSSRRTRIQLRELGPRDVATLHALLELFGTAFEQEDVYTGTLPSARYHERLLANQNFIALVALRHGELAGGLAAYELPKFEQERSEIYIYDLAVARAHRRQGVASALLDEIRRIAARRGAWVVYVQADYGDGPAIALYEKVGAREDVLHFDMEPIPDPEPAGEA